MKYLHIELGEGRTIASFGRYKDNPCVVIEPATTQGVVGEISKECDLEHIKDGSVIISFTNEKAAAMFTHYIECAVKDRPEDVSEFENGFEEELENKAAIKAVLIEMDNDLGRDVMSENIRNYIHQFAKKHGVSI